MGMYYGWKGVTQMYCMKCGKEIPEKQSFCDNCLVVMEQFPVKPGTPALLPNRPAPAPLKRSASRKRVLSPEDRLARAKKAIQWLSIILAVTLFALFLSVTLLIDAFRSEVPEKEIGQNYSTVGAVKNTD